MSVIRFFIFFLILAVLRESEQLLIVYFLAVLFFVEGNWPPSYQHRWSQRMSQSCQGNSFCLGSHRGESDRNILQRTKVFCCMSYKHVCGPFTANGIYLPVSESTSYTVQRNEMELMLLTKTFKCIHRYIIANLNWASLQCICSVVQGHYMAMLKYWHKSNGFSLLEGKGSLVFSTTWNF